MKVWRVSMKVIEWHEHFVEMESDEEPSAEMIDDLYCDSINATDTEVEVVKVSVMEEEE